MAIDGEIRHQHQSLPPVVCCLLCFVCNALSACLPAVDCGSPCSCLWSSHTLPAGWPVLHQSSSCALAYPCCVTLLRHPDVCFHISCCLILMQIWTKAARDWHEDVSFIDVAQLPRLRQLRLEILP